MEIQKYMATIQVTVPDQQLSALQRKAEAAKLTVDELIQQTIAELLVNSSDTEKAVNYVLNKNKELYKRLA